MGRWSAALRFRWAVVGLILLLAPAAGLAGDGRLIWRTVDTPHFQVHYPQGWEAVAWRSARICEEAHEVLTPILTHVPTQRTQVVITDFGDSANGSATALPYLRVNLFAAPPDLDGNLNDFDDWLRVLIYHEYVHILHLDTVSGVPDWLNAAFGKRFAPNQNMPRFLIEGIAVWLESLTSGHGRIRSALFRGYLRMQAMEGRLSGLDEVVHAPLEWPGANVWYLYGGHFLNWLASTRPDRGVARMNHEVSDDLFPFALNRSATVGFGQTFEDLWHLWQGDLKAEAHGLKARLEAEGGLTPLSRVTSRGRLHRRPRFLADGRLAAIESDGLDARAIYGWRLQASGRPEPRGPDAPDGGEIVVRVDATSNFDVCPGGLMVLDQSERVDQVYSVTDLYTWSADERRLRRVTRGARVREPACAPDGRWVAAVQVVRGRTRLVRVDLADARVTPLFDPGDLNQVGFPTVSPDGQTVVVTRLSQRTGRDLVAVPAQGGPARPLTDDGALELTPRFSPDGKWLVYASDRTGVFDLYALPWGRKGPPRRLTRTLGGVYDPVISPDGSTLAMIRVSAGGFDVATAPFQPEVRLGVEPPRAAPPPPRPAALEAPLASRPYAPLETFAPVDWSPEFSFTDVEGSTSQLGLSVEAVDAAVQHVLIGNFTTDPDDEAYFLDAAYSFRRLRPVFSLGARRFTRTLGTASVYNSARQPYQEALTTLAASVSLPFTRTGHGTSVSMRYDITRYEAARNLEPEHDPLDVEPRSPATEDVSSLVFGLSYSDAEAWPESISGEEGQRGSVTFRIRDDRLGSDHNSAEVFFNYTRFWSAWRRHAVGLRLNGAYGRGTTRGSVRYGLGPAPERNLLLDVLDQIRFGSGFLRGYPGGTETGNRYVLGTLEYRVPINDVFRGLSSVPFFYRRLAFAVFTDFAQATDDPFSAKPSDFSRAWGLELNSQATVAWREPFNVRLGYARGIDDKGEGQFYFFLGNWF